MTLNPIAAARVALGLTLGVLATAGCNFAATTAAKPNPIVGTWIVKDAAAPFPYHMYVFNADGTLQQANPDAGDPNSSDSDGKGVWVADRDRIKGKWVEITADRATHQYSGRTEISFDVRVSADTYTGSESVSSYGTDGTLNYGPTRPTLLEGKRVTLP